MQQSTVLVALLLLAATLAGVASAETAPDEAIEIGRSHLLESKLLEQTRRINVYLPKSYDESPQRHYPVLYLLDGGVREDFVHITGLASLAADYRNLREFLVVGIENIDRYHDLTSPTAVEAERQRLPTAGGAAEFRTFLGRELLPWVKSRFRVTGETVLIGESLAGHFVVETYLEQPRMFQGYVAVSPSLWWNDQRLAKGAASALRRPRPADRHLFLAIADEGGAMQEGLDRLLAALAAVSASSWTFEPFPGETHGTIFHPAAWTALRQLFALEPAGSGQDSS
ncbi:MAG: alpha/beta hydrolase-fold protein [Acidobacteriota bacterium]